MLTILKTIKNGDTETKYLEKRLMPAMLIETVSAMLLNLVGTFLTGNLSSTILAGVGQGYSLTNPLICGLQALAVGGGVLVANHIGAGERGKTQKTAAQALLSGFLLSTLIAVILFIFREPILGFLFNRSGADVMRTTVGYFHFAVLAAPFWFIYFQIALIFRSCGNSKAPMTINIIMNILNIVLSYFFISGGLGIPSMGALGAGLAVLVSVFCSALLSIVFIIIIPIDAKITSLSVFTPDIKEIFAVNKVGIPAMNEMLFFFSAKIIMQSMVSGLGAAAISAIQIMSTMSSFFVIYGDALCGITASIVANAAGSGSKKKSNETLRYFAAKCRLAMLISGVLYVILTIPLTGIFTKDPLTYHHAVVLNYIQAAGISLFWSSGFIYSCGFRGARDVKYAMIATTLNSYFSRILVFFLLLNVFRLDYISVALVMSLDWAIRSVIYYNRFRSRKWLWNIPNE